MIENLWICLNGVVPLFLLIGLGVLFEKYKIVDETFGQKATTLVFRVALPVMIFTDVAGADIAENFDGFAVLLALLSAVVSFFLCGILAAVFLKDNKMRAAAAQGAYRANYAILGLPLTKALFGAAGAANGSVLLATSMVLVNILAVITLEGFLGKDRGLRHTLLDIAKNPILLSALLGTIVNLSGLTLPVVAEKTLFYLGDMCVPLSLITIGISMRQTGLRGTFSAPALLASLFKTFFMPLLFFPIAYALGVRGDVLGTLFIFWASPAAVAGYAMTRDRGGDHHLYGSIIVLSTVLSFFVIFFGVFLLKTLHLL